MGLDWHLYLAVGIFISVILAIAFDLLPMVVASLLGTAILYLSGTVDSVAHSAARTAADPVLSLLIGGMVVTRSLAPTGVFEWATEKLMRFFEGQGWRLLVGIFLLTSVVSSVLPNEIAIVLLAPIIVEAAQRFKIDIVPLLLLAVFAANTAGLLTLVGDPATYIAGNSINETFAGYMHRMSTGGFLAAATVFALLPVVFREIWQKHLTTEATETENINGSAAKIKRPIVLALLLLIMGLMVVFFVIGDSLPTPIAPQLSCLAFGTLALTVVHLTKLDNVDDVIHDVDWETIVFLASVFILVQALECSGAIHLLAITMAQVLGKSVVFANMTILAGVGLFSGFVPNAPLVATMVPVVKGYVVHAGHITPEVLARGADALPNEVLAFFCSMLLGATLGGNLTLLGAAGNIVACGICARNGSRVTFLRFLRYGAPVTVCQLLVSGLFVWIRFLLH
jgi:Na+/H+ antiporter NhaD/arsenite permease-like protein